MLDGRVLWLASSGDPGAQAFTDPSFWLNAGALGVIAGLFVLDKLHSSGALDRVERANHGAMDELRKQHETSVKAQRDAHEGAMQRMDDHVRQLIVERDRANGERNEAIAVMRDFTMMAGAVLGQQNPPWKQPPPTRGGET